MKSSGCKNIQMNVVHDQSNKLVIKRKSNGLITMKLSSALSFYKPTKTTSESEIQIMNQWSEDPFFNVEDHIKCVITQELFGRGSSFSDSQSSSSQSHNISSTAEIFMGDKSSSIEQIIEYTTSHSTTKAPTELLSFKSNRQNNSQDEVEGFVNINLPDESICDHNYFINNEEPSTSNSDPILNSNLSDLELENCLIGMIDFDSKEYNISDAVELDEFDPLFLNF